jgi:hypothetical protein
MFGYSPNPAQILPLTVVTSDLIVQGVLQTRLRRLTDVLNEPSASHLLLSDATFMEVGSRRVVAAGMVSQVQLSDVLFAHANGPTDPGSEMRTPKQPIRATLLLPPFTLEGQIHLAYESEIRLALDAYEGRFMPVTGARYWAYGVAEAPNYVEMVVVNHARCHVAIPAGVQWLTEAPGGHGVGAAQNPW